LFEWKWTEAEQAFRRAIELNPAYAPAHQWLGFVLGMTARFDEAKQSLKVAQELDPFSASINTSAVWPQLWARRSSEARQGFRAAVEVHPGYWVAHYYLALSCALEGDWSNAVLSARQAVELGDSPWKFAGAGFVYGKAGLIPEAMAILNRIEEEVSRPQRPGASFYAAAVHAGLGNKDRALRLLWQAAAERHWNIAWLKVDPFWDDMRSDPEFLRLEEDTICRRSAS
jgi:tetratricopeptide (TPR) repeat protein